MVNYDYLFNKEYNKEKFQTNCFVNKKLGCQILSNAYFLPHKNIEGLWCGGGGLLDSVGNFIPSSFIHTGGGRAYDPTGVKHSDETVIYLGMFFNLWGHCLTDNLRRLWFLKSDLYRKYFKDCPLVYIPFQNFDFETNSKNFKRLLEILEIDCNNFQTPKEVTQYKNIILPDESFITYTGGLGPRFFTNEYVEMIDRIRDFAIKHKISIPKPFKKIYFFHGSKQIGEERIAEYFSSKGYEILSPEKLSFDEQLNVLINCENFASTVGSCSHNVMFLRDNTEVILIPRAHYTMGYQIAMDQIHNLNINYIDSSLSLFSDIHYPWTGPFYYLLSANLLKFFGDDKEVPFKYGNQDFINFIKYLKQNHDRGLGFNPQAKEYYGEIAMNFLSQLKQQETLLKEENITIN